MMGRATSYTILMTGFAVLFYYTGLSGSSSLVQYLVNPQSMTSFQVVALIGSAILSSASGIAIGIFTKNAELAVMTAIVPVLFGLLWDFILVFNAISSINTVLAVLFMGPVLFLYWMTLVDWWRGATS